MLHHVIRHGAAPRFLLRPELALRLAPRQAAGQRAPLYAIMGGGSAAGQYESNTHPIATMASSGMHLPSHPSPPPDDHILADFQALLFEANTERV